MKYFTQNNFSNYDLIIFDLDNTLYKETDYLYVAYKEISLFLSKIIKLDPNDIYSFIISEFEEKGRNNLLDKVFYKYSIEKTNFLKKCLSIMQTTNISPLIELNYNAVFMLKEAIKNRHCCILTNGNVTQQKNKIKSINWQPIYSIPKVFYANELKPKPSSYSFKFISEYFNLKNEGKVLMVGDSNIDYNFSKSVGADFLKINL